MRTSSFSGIIIGIAVAISGLGAMAGYGLISFGTEIQNSEVAQEVREELESRSLFDIFLGTDSEQTKAEQDTNHESISPATRLGDHLFVRA